MKAKRAAVSGDRTLIETAAVACHTAYSAELDPHFVVEETVLLPLLFGAGEEALVAQVESDHQILRDLCAQLQQADATTLLRFAECLTAHVRFEERELFGVVERLLEA